jgi:hypothetical protein
MKTKKTSQMQCDGRYTMMRITNEGSDTAYLEYFSKISHRCVQLVLRPGECSLIEDGVTIDTACPWKKEWEQNAPAPKRLRFKEMK